MYLGSHVSFNKNDQLLGSLEEALSYGATTFMFYTGAPQNTMRYSIDDSITLKALKKMKEVGMDPSKVIVHAPYIVNLANNGDPSKYDFSIHFLQEEVKRCEILGIRYMVLHPGSHVGLGMDVGIQNIIFGLNQILGNTSVTILLETMAGKGSEVGSRFEEIKEIIDGVEDKDHIGVCMDTCHMNDAGYDVHHFDDLLDEFDQIVGLQYVHCIHINDSKNPVSSHKDRHENIGFGTLGFDTLLSIIYNERLEDIPKILETPYIDHDFPPYKEEIAMIKEKKFHRDLLEEIRNNAK